MGRVLRGTLRAASQGQDLLERSPPRLGLVRGMEEEGGNFEFEYELKLKLKSMLCVIHICSVCLVPKIQKYLCIYKYAVRTHARSLLRNSSIVAVAVPLLPLLLLFLLLLLLLVVIFPAPCFASGLHLIFRVSTQLKCLFSFTSVRKNCYFHPPPLPLRQHSPQLVLNDMHMSLLYGNLCSRPIRNVNCFRSSIDLINRSRQNMQMSFEYRLSSLD